MLDDTKIQHSFGYAFEGLIFAFKENRNIRIHTMLGSLAVIMGLILRLNYLEFLMILLSTVLVIGAEMINTSIEEMTNLITTEHRKEAKIAKDVAAGMVLITAFGALVVGVVIFIPYFLKLI
ncbi:MAG TPA: diacylglycerol kinase family protein [Patescibacteria group bacterium]|nr:diacylglycerol kinase family protein [Patescibacteria group bacterium]